MNDDDDSEEVLEAVVLLTLSYDVHLDLVCLLLAVYKTQQEASQVPDRSGVDIASYQIWHVVTSKCALTGRAVGQELDEGLSELSIRRITDSDIHITKKYGNELPSTHGAHRRRRMLDLPRGPATSNSSLHGDGFLISSCLSPSPVVLMIGFSGLSIFEGVTYDDSPLVRVISYKMNDAYGNHLQSPQAPTLDGEADQK